MSSQAAVRALRPDPGAPPPCLVLDGEGPEREIALLIRRLLTLLGEDPERDGLQRTPDRVARMLRWLTRGSDQTAVQAVGRGTFEQPHEDMILVRNIEVYSLCEHHMLPFLGKMHVAYVPDGRIIGLSKIPRLVEVFARRLQVQERLTVQVADALMAVLAPKGVGVVMEAQHLCMMMRGVEKQGSSTVTSAVRGILQESATRREEFERLLRRSA